MAFGTGPYALVPYGVAFAPEPPGPPDVTVLAVRYPRFLDATTYTRTVDGLVYTRELEAVSYT